ncbi:S-crystallin [Trema orientale]|uniref:Glutathione S-transferase n=1 Tax=Trema orientale TaxID=63057 RepID=A0A2P5D199_TREOI|nr:S-crystallin [Trema orientale]
MGEKHSDDVVLLGTWQSGYCKRVELALKLKGIPFEFVEEDLSNKSELLLHHNPVHKKVPVLVHKGKTILESLVILEYIDEHWKNSPKLLPDNPYQRAKVRFWAHFYDQKIMVAILPIIISSGKEQEKAIEDMNESLRVFEDGIKKDFPGKFPFNDQNLGLLDVIVGTSICNYQALNEAVTEVLSPEKTPAELLSWVNALKEHPLVKDTLPPHDKLVNKLRKKLFQSRKV